MTRMFTCLAASALLALNATAAEATQQEDVQCLLGMGSLQTNSDVKLKNLGISGALFFLGKIVGESPSINLAAVMKAEEAKIMGQSIQAMLKRCTDEFNHRGAQLQTAGQGLAATHR